MTRGSWTPGCGCGPGASATGFTTWEDELGLDRWRTGDVFGEAELPVLFAHGQHNRPDSVVLATTEYRRAYAGKLPQVLARLMDGHLVWIGFSFADQRIAAILREIADRSGTRADPGAAPRHVAIMPWDPAGDGNDPGILARRAEIDYGAQVVLYPAPGGDHSALAVLLSTLTDARFPPAGDLPARASPSGERPDERGHRGRAWCPGAVGAAGGAGGAFHRAGRGAGPAGPVGRRPAGRPGRGDRVGGCGQDRAGHPLGAGGGRVSRRPGVRGVFGWSFYADPSAEHWADGPAGVGAAGPRDRGDRAPAGWQRRCWGCCGRCRCCWCWTGWRWCRRARPGTGSGGCWTARCGRCWPAPASSHGGLVVLTSRFPFADLETFDGGSARMLEVPPFTPAEGAALLAAAGGGWLAEDERRELVAAVDGHALATGVLAGLLADRPPASDLAALRAEPGRGGPHRCAGRPGAGVLRRRGWPSRTGTCWRRCRCSPGRSPPQAVLAVAAHEAFGGRLAGWTPAMVQAAVRDRLGGLASWHPDGTISAHPLVRDTFRPLVMDAAETAADTALAGVPAGMVTSRADALRVVEAIELLLDAGQWQPADDMYRARCDDGEVWMNLPAARLGQRAATAFVATPARRDACAAHLGPRRLRLLPERGRPVRDGRGRPGHGTRVPVPGRAPRP